MLFYSGILILIQLSNKKIKVFKRQILFLINNAGIHSITDEPKKKFTLLFNLTILSQPLDMGIIVSFKALYRKALVRHRRIYACTKMNDCELLEKSGLTDQEKSGLVNKMKN